MLFALSPTQETTGYVAVATLLAIAGVFLLLPRPRGRFVPGGIALLIAAAAVFGTWLYRTFGQPMPDVIGSALFWLFSAGAVVFGTVLVTQRNPARGALAFAFVILSTCGLFLLLAATFLMAATIIIYAGAIVVTFLFVLMLSPSHAPTDENDRSREPLAGALAGFAFVGLVLLALFQTSLTNQRDHLLAQLVTPLEREKLAAAIAQLDAAEKALAGDTSTAVAREQRLAAFDAAFSPVRNALAEVVGVSSAEQIHSPQEGSLPQRLGRLGTVSGGPEKLFRADVAARQTLTQAATVRELLHRVPPTVEAIISMPAAGQPVDVATAQAEVRKLRDAVVLLHGAGLMPARNVANLGYGLYAEHLLAIELAGVLLLVATIGAVAISHRKREPLPTPDAKNAPAGVEGVQ
ncbi:MAG: NADH-quinone oxidoreductase subunit J [Gemmataceae bacterium]|nr:NADH-quinone oxidoreductase subunit J [Gemmata sp.]MDW8198147.1 NADH-quinone oxidoreductase subunit J [Gemmataceae bacterium]